MSVLSQAFKDSEELDSVVFIHDYVQLTFKDVVLSILCDFSVIEPEEGALRTGDAGFCDAVVGFIEDRVVSVLESPDQLVLRFQSGRQISISFSDADGPEVFTLHQPGRPTIVG